MSEAKDDDKNRSIDFSEFWDNFQIIPWKWMDDIFRKPTILLISVGVVYAIFGLVTYFPDNGVLQPKNLFDAGYFSFANYIDSDRLLFLIHYPSTHILLIALLIVVLLIIRWRHKIPDFFQWLWESNNFDLSDDEFSERYQQHLFEYQKALLSKWGHLVFGLVLSLLFAGLVKAAGVFPFLDLVYEPGAATVIKGIFVVATFWLFLLGQLCWAVSVTTRFIKNLPNHLPLKIRMSHPDGCGGLKPIGDFVIDLAVILIVAGLAFTAVIILDMDIDEVIPSVSSVFLFAVVGPLSALVVFLPIWNLHESMVAYRNSYLDQYGNQLRDLETVIFEQTRESGKLELANEAREKLEILRSLHPETKAIPVWPIRVTSTVLFISTPQIIQTAYELLMDINWDSIDLPF